MRTVAVKARVPLPAGLARAMLLIGKINLTYSFPVQTKSEFCSPACVSIIDWSESVVQLTVASGRIDFIKELNLPGSPVVPQVMPPTRATS